jgi:hypothetical protein
MDRHAAPPLLGLLLLAVVACGIVWAATRETGPAISPPPAEPLFGAEPQAPSQPAAMPPR